MQVFRNITGVNFASINISEILNELNSDDLQEDSDFVGILEDDVLVDYDESALPTGEETNRQPVVVEVSYRERYISRLQQDADVHYHSIQFNPRDIVLLQKDFDMIRRQEEEKWTISMKQDLE
jgi:hypothetical protein